MLLRKSHKCEEGGHNSKFRLAFVDKLEKQLLLKNIKKTVKVGQ